MQPKKIAELQGICKKYETDKLILNKINLTINEQELISLTGVSGSGKSTLLHILGLLDNCDQGKVLFYFDKLDNYNQDHIRLHNIGFVYQSPCLMKDFSVMENIMIPAILKGDSNKTAKMKAIILLEKISLIDKRDSLPKLLSGGEAQRVSIARALINNPQLIIADEPTCNLDKNNAVKIINLLRENLSKNSSCIFSTHDSSLSCLSDVNYHIDNGHLIHNANNDT